MPVHICVVSSFRRMCRKAAPQATATVARRVDSWGEREKKPEKSAASKTATAF